MIVETQAQSRISSVARLYAKLFVSILRPAIYLFTVHIDRTVCAAFVRVC